MLSYIGSGHYCYANSSSMLLETIGEKVSPAVLEVLSGVGIGAMWHEEQKVIYFGQEIPDRGVSHALELLGFRWTEKSGDAEGEPPLEELRRDVENGPVLLGPLDMGYLTYKPNAAYLGGADHFVLAYRMDWQTSKRNFARRFAPNNIVPQNETARFTTQTQKPIHADKNMLPAFFTEIGTQSSAATIPVTLNQTKKNGVSEKIADFVVPLCATIYLSGSTITLVSCSMAVMMLNDMTTSFGVMFPFILMLGVTMIAAPGVPGGAVMAALGLMESMLGFDTTLTSLMIALYIDKIASVPLVT